MSRTRHSYPATFLKACYVLWCVHVKGFSQTQTAIAVELNVGTVSKIVNRHRFPMAYPIPLPTIM